MDGKTFKRGEAIEDWVCRYYIERPLFDDGLPVHFGHLFIGENGIGNVSSIEFKQDGCVVIKDVRGNRAEACGFPKKGWTVKRYDSCLQDDIDRDMELIAANRACAYWAGSDTASCSDCPHRKENGVSKECLADAMRDLLKRQRYISSLTGE